jgi:hypothetical protein
MLNEKKQNNCMKFFPGTHFADTVLSTSFLQFSKTYGLQNRIAYFMEFV